MIKNTPLLIDLDGVLRLNYKPAPDLEKFLDYISSKNIDACILSNSTLMHSREIIDYFNSCNISIQIPIITAADATSIYVKSKYSKVMVVANESVQQLFEDLVDVENPQAVIIGDIGEKWSTEILNNIFLKIMNGAEIIAMQKNRYWNSPEHGLLLDAGTYVSAIEYATKKKAKLIGKPSPHYFYAGLKQLGYNDTDHFIMIGDDVDSDINGVKELNATSILMYSGKTKKGEFIDNPADYESDNLKSLIHLLDGL